MRTLYYLALAVLLLAASGCIDQTAGSLGDIFESISYVACFLRESIIYMAGAIAVFFIVWAGLKWTGSQDNPQERTQAKKMIEGVIIGLMIVAVSAAIIAVIVRDPTYVCGRGVPLPPIKK